MSYRLTMASYCGMRIPVRDRDDLESCRLAAARMIRRHRRQGGRVTQIDGQAWELETPEDALLVGDSEGILKIDRLPSCARCECDFVRGEPYFLENDDTPYCRECAQLAYEDGLAESAALDAEEAG